VSELPEGTEQERVLVVDDQAVNLELLSHILAAAGYEVQVASSGARALQVAQADPPDIVLLDVIMPGLSGLEVAERLKELPETRSVPVIFLSALASVEDKVRGFTAGGVDYITKPFQAREVVARVPSRHSAA
jgi:DNA-binding response OmpR family regulator